MLNPFADAEVIHSISRADLLADGNLVAASPELMANAKIRFPVAYTASVHADCIAWTARDAEKTGISQDIIGREWDVLWMLRTAMRRVTGDLLSFQVSRVSRDGTGTHIEPEEVTLHAHIGPGDTAEPVITVVSDLSEL